MDYHVFRKQKRLKNGKIVHRWYYYYLDENKKQVQKACKACKTRKEAEDYIRALSCAGENSAETLIKTLGRDMFLPNSGHINRLLQLGRVYDEYTLLDARRFMGYIINDWGERALASINPAELTRHLVSKPRSGQWKNRYIRIFKELYDEAAWRGFTINPPRFNMFAINPRKADVLTTEELKRLFAPENFISDIFYTMFLLCLSGGLRLGEVRAVRRKQIFFDRKVLLIDGFCKRDCSRTTYNKKGSPENPRLRVTMLPDFTLQKLSEYVKTHPVQDDDFLFTEIAGKPLTQDRAHYGFEKAVIKSGINKEGRKIVCHSLRYTYVTRMRRELSAETVMKMVGHTSLEMTDYYTSRRALDEAIAAISGATSAVDKLFY